jgi:hypothetical protein
LTRLLHVLNGDATRIPLESSGVPGDLIVWADVLHDGPVPDVPPERLRPIRATQLSSEVNEPAPDVLRALERRDAALEGFADYSEVVFWFEHDLYDQLILIRHLDWLSRVDRGRTEFTLICIGAFPGRPNFAGLGELSPPELATLYPQRRPVTRQQIELGRYAWGLFRAEGPTELSEWLAVSDTSALPFLAGALHRYLEDFPSTSNGLSRSERQILRAIHDGHETPGAVFVATQRMEERVFMGDLTFWSIVRRMALSRIPLLTIVPDVVAMPVADGRVELTPAGEDVLSGRADHIALNGIDRWMGGTHLTAKRYWRVITPDSKLQTPKLIPFGV